MSTAAFQTSMDMPDGFEERLGQRAAIKKNPLSTIPTNEMHMPLGNIPNTPLAASTISFLLGSVFSLALLAFISGALGRSPWAYYQLGFFVTAWAAFHWGEFAVTAGWNLHKCSVDCEHYSVTLPDIGRR
jgi:protein-S-isoprenylcysteine O-methyltransferase